MTAVAAWRDGAARVNRAPAILVSLWLVTIVMSVPLAVVMRSLIMQQLGQSLTADSVATGVNYDWMQEFAAQAATGVGSTFRPTIIGFGAVLDNLSAFVDRTPRPAAIVGVSAAYILLWMFTAGGIVDRYARDRAVHAHGFFSASGVFFWRFLRLGAFQLAAYSAVFGAFHPWLFDTIFARATREMTSERNAFVVRVLLYVAFALVLGALNLVFDYAKVRAVVEDRRSMIAAVGAAVRFVRRAPAAAGLYLLNGVVFLAVIAAYALVAPSAGRSGIGMWAAFALTQLFVAARLWVKLTFWASETALFQSRLAHAAYVGRPRPAWPDSPEVEAIVSSDLGRG